MKYRIVTCDEGGRFASNDVVDVAKWARMHGMTVLGTKQQRPGARIKLRDELIGHPIISGLLGPMWGGTEDGAPVIRYEDQRAYDRLSA